MLRLAKDQAAPRRCGAFPDERCFFRVLYALHPVLPVMFLLLMANGLVAPMLYTLRMRRPFNLRGIRESAKAGNAFATYVYFSWLAFVIPTALIVFMLVLSLVLK